MKSYDNCELVKNSICTADVHGYTSAGHGVCRINGRAVFVPGALHGERWRVKILKTAKSVVFGRGEELLRASGERIQPDCPVFPRCGGCALRHMSYAEELDFKLSRVDDAISRIAGLELKVERIIAAKELSGYRNKGIYAVGTGEDGIVSGYFRIRSHDIIPVSRCLLMPERVDIAVASVREWMEKCSVPAYDEKAGSGLIRHVFSRTSREGEMLLCLVSAGSIPKTRQLLETVSLNTPGITGIVLNINKSFGNTVLAGSFETLWGNGFIYERLGGLEFRLSPRSFFQVNTAQAEFVYALAREMAEPEGKTVMDIYCGTGTIGLSMARSARRIIGVDVVPEAIGDARENARRNGIDNAEFFCGDALECARELFRMGERPEVLIVDPPRRGLASGVCEAIAEIAPERVVYVSCDPATLARDLKLFAELGFAAERAVAVDMFPRTAHVETVVLLSKNNRTSQ